MTTVHERLETAASEVRDLADNAPIPTYPTRRIQPLRRNVPGWAVAAVAALLVLVVVGGAALLFRGDAATTDPASPAIITPTTQPAVSPRASSSDPIDGTAIGTTLTGVDTPGDINAGEKWLWVDDKSALYRIDPTTLEMTAVDYGRTSPQQRTITVSSYGPWVKDQESGSGPIVRVDPDTATLAFDWLFRDSEYVISFVAGGEALWATAGGQIFKLDADTGTVISRANTAVDVFNPLIFEDGSLWGTRWRDSPNRSYVVVRLNTELEVASEIELPNVDPGWFFNDQMVSGDGYIFLTGYVCDCPDPWNADDPIGRIVRIDPATNTITTKPIEGFNEYAEKVGPGPFLDLAYGDGWLWGVRLVDDRETRDIVRIDPTTLEIVGGPITTEPLPWAIEVAFGRLWITHYNDGVITIIDLADLN